MKKCPKCNKEVKATDKFCSNCGKTLKKNSKKEEKLNQDEIFSKIGDNLEKILDKEDTSKDYTKKDIEDNKGLAILSYLWIFALIPYYKKDESKYVKYHAIQGMNLLIIWIIYSITAFLLSFIKITKSCDHFLGGVIINCVKETPWWISLPIDIVGLLLFALNIIGIVYAITGKAKKLPIVEKVNIIK